MNARLTATVVLNMAIEAVDTQRLDDTIEMAEDIAYNQAIEDAKNALRRLANEIGASDA